MATRQNNDKFFSKLTTHIHTHTYIYLYILILHYTFYFRGLWILPVPSLAEMERNRKLVHQTLTVFITPPSSWAVTVLGIFIDHHQQYDITAKLTDPHPADPTLNHHGWMIPWYLTCRRQHFMIKSWYEQQRSAEQGYY